MELEKEQQKSNAEMVPLMDLIQWFAIHFDEDPQVTIITANGECVSQIYEQMTRGSVQFCIQIFYNPSQFEMDKLELPLEKATCDSENPVTLTNASSATNSFTSDGSPVSHQSASQANELKTKNVMMGL